MAKHNLTRCITNADITISILKDDTNINKYFFKLMVTFQYQNMIANANNRFLTEKFVTTNSRETRRPERKLQDSQFYYLVNQITSQLHDVAITDKLKYHNGS